MKKASAIIMVVLLAGVSCVFAQKGDTCRVLLKDISGSYKGDCRDGLANGKGVAKGKDTYTGIFVNGLPDGKGKYVYENGNSFTGSWSKGQKNGPGKFVYFIAGTAYVQKGYWVNGDYAGISDPAEFYRITGQSYIQSCTIRKLEGSESKVKISFMASMSRYVPTDLRISNSSGQLLPAIKDAVIIDYHCPLNCDVRFLVITSAGNYTANLIFEILKPGSYEVLVTTD